MLPFDARTRHNPNLPQRKGAVPLETRPTGQELSASAECDHAFHRYVPMAVSRQMCAGAAILLGAQEISLSQLAESLAKTPTVEEDCPVLKADHKYSGVPWLQPPS